ncbi:MAG: tRNA (guanine-N(7)-)-methyltransferase [Opitutia bacterium UBA7350]|nr:MAG: tRNA (guanine-N(7)-)-methyltransferase [Opitutae bacterium UBA7350]
MELSAGHARELAKQAARKDTLREDCLRALDGVERIVFEAGCGHGHWLTAYAAAHPEQCCVGIDLIARRIRKAQEKCSKRNLPNLHFFKAELGEFLEILAPSLRFEMTILLFPDPWPKVRHHRRRMVQTAFLDKLAERTYSGGCFCFRSDDRTYFDWTTEHLQMHPEWGIDPTGDWPYERETYFQKMMAQYYSVLAYRR